MGNITKADVERLAGQLDTIKDWWRAPGLTAEQAATMLTELWAEVERLREVVDDIRKAAKLAAALSDQEDAPPWRMIEERTSQALKDTPA